MDLNDLITFILFDPLPQPIIYQNEKFISLLPNVDEDGNIIKTFCNVAVWYVSTQLGCPIFDSGYTANEMVDIMEANLNEVSAQDAQDASARGQLVIAGKKYSAHGHVAIVAPSANGDLYFSPSWQRYVPYLANVGARNGILPVSEAFPVTDDEPSYYLWKPQ